MTIFKSAKIVELESRIQELETENIDLKGQIEAAKQTAETDQAVALSEANEKIKSLTEANEEIPNLNQTISDKESEIVKLQENLKNFNEKASVKASELLAENGHPAPVAINDDDNASENKLTRDQFNALDHIQRNEFIKNGGKIK